MAPKLDNRRLRNGGFGLLAALVVCGAAGCSDERPSAITRDDAGNVIGGGSGGSTGPVDEDGGVVTEDGGGISPEGTGGSTPPIGGETGAGGQTGIGGDTGSGGTVGTPGSGGAAGSVAPPIQTWTDLTQPGISVAGGSAVTAAGIGREGGTVHLLSRGTIQHDLAAPAPAATGVDVAGEAVTSAMLAANVASVGSLHVSGNVTSGGADAVRTISSNGDIVVDGVLRAAALGGATQTIEIKAWTGTVFISGAVDASGAPGVAGGAVTIIARRIVVTGRIATRGGDASAAAAAAGAVTLNATELVNVTGAVDAAGGNGSGDARAVGGRGGDIILTGADVQLAGHIKLRGGAASSMAAEAEGGAAGLLRIDGGTGAYVGGIVDGRGGPARAAAAGGAALGGAGGSLKIGETSAPQAIVLAAPLSAVGGPGHGGGGKGGVVSFEAQGGDMRVADVDVGGGSSQTKGGDAGSLTGRTGPTAGGILVAGTIRGNGGSVEAGGAGDGGLGATVLVTSIFLNGPIKVEANAQILSEGGQSGGAGHAGGGGKVDLITWDGDISMAGKISVRGGVARDSGGAGGLGGPVNIFSDDNHDGIGGNLTVEATGLIDASGGAGTIGGSARNNGGGGVALFPQGVDKIAVLLNSDGLHGSPKNGALQNLGKVIARGAPGNGWGGDVIYHGRQPGLSKDPLPGHVEMDADGTGQPGEYVAE